MKFFSQPKILLATVNSIGTDIIHELSGFDKKKSFKCRLSKTNLQLSKLLYTCSSISSHKDLALKSLNQTRYNSMSLYN